MPGVQLLVSWTSFVCWEGEVLNIFRETFLQLRWLLSRIEVFLLVVVVMATQPVFQCAEVRRTNRRRLERERDFYYSKLREIEVLCQQNEGKEPPFLNEVMTILYKTDADDEFVAPAEVPAEA